MEEVLSAAGHIPEISKAMSVGWPEFREYAHQKYPDDLDEDVITMIEDLIERRRQKRAMEDPPRRRGRKKK